MIPAMRWSHVQPGQVKTDTFSQQRNAPAENIHPGLSHLEALCSTLGCFKSDFENVSVEQICSSISGSQTPPPLHPPTSGSAPPHPTPQPLTTLHSSNIRDIDLSICNALQDDSGSGVTLETHAVTFVGFDPRREGTSGLAKHVLSSSTPPMQ